MVVAKETGARGVYEFLVADGEKLPFAYVPDALYLCLADGYALVAGLYAYGVVLVLPYQLADDDSDTY